MEAEAPQQARLIETLAAGVAHEVRIPLNSLQINVGILDQELKELLPDSDAHVFAVLRKIAGEIKHLDDFVSEFLRFARPPRLKVERLRVRPLIADGDRTAPDVRSDTRAAVRRRCRRLRLQRWHLRRVHLRVGWRRRPRRAGGRLHPRLSAPPAGDPQRPARGHGPSRGSPEPRRTRGIHGTYTLG